MFSINLKKVTEHIIFNAKWLLIPFYFGLIYVLGVYAYAYTKDIIHLNRHTQLDELMLKILEFIDILMIANLVKMVIAGSYNSFVSKEHGRKNENVSSGTLKVKISTSLIGIVSIKLLEGAVKVFNLGWNDLSKLLSIAGAFVVVAISLSLIDYLHAKTEKVLHDVPH